MKARDTARITVNGRVLEAREAAAEGRLLLDWLRDELGLTAAKRGCAAARR